jgi:hypothetical protein
MSHRGYNLIPLAFLLVSTVFAQDSRPLGDVARQLRAEPASTTTLPPNPRADQILNLMAETYKHCTTYRDSGVLTTNNKTFRTATFSTAFVRPDRFRFEYQMVIPVIGRTQRNLVWREGQDVRSWSDDESEISNERSFESAIAGATGVSLGSAYEIPSLLLPDEIEGRRLTSMKSATRLDDAKLGEINCFRVRGELGKSSITVWIDSKTLLIRKIEEAFDVDNSPAEQTTTYQPVINEQVPEQKLSFSPPSR